MTVTDDVFPAPSVPPPGWREGGAGRLVPPPDAAHVRLAAAPGPVGGRPRPDRPSLAADAAVRWRMGAAAFDYALTVVAYAALCVLLHWAAWLPAHMLVFLGLHLGYHGLCEYRSGQTIGKRRAGVRVVALDGSAPSARSIAIRTLLRVVDSLPTWYASGLLHMLRTGPRRRQRIGDTVAGTLVVAVDGRAAQRGTPRWYLPVAAVLAVALSVPAVLATIRGGSAPLTSAQQEQFVAGCTVHEPAALCECLLPQLQAEGITSRDEIGALFVRAAQATSAGRPDLMPAALVRAVAACRGNATAGGGTTGVTGALVPGPALIP